VVLLLFIIGLELEPRRLWVMRRYVFGLGGAQLAATGLALGAAALWLGLDWRAATVTGLGLALSSTALVLTALAERGQLAARHGREAFAVLLFQDMAVIPMIALLPLLAGGASGMQLAPALKGLAAILVVVAASRRVVRPALQAVARWGGREVFTAAALLLVVGAALGMELIGLSPSLGAFLAGVLVADSEFRHELEADIEPFKGLLLGLFFIAVGMSANLGLLGREPLLVLALALGLMALKFAIAALLSRAMGAPWASALGTGDALSQGGEFAFVLFTAAAGFGVLDAATAELLVLAVTLSLVISPLVFALHDRQLTRWRARAAQPEFDVIDDPARPVIIAGYGRVGQIISRVLRMCGIEFTALELSYQQVDFVRRFGNKVYYGDASRIELLQASKAGEAKLFVLAIDDVEASLRTAAVVRRHFPELPILARARNRSHVFRLRDLGVRMIMRDTYPASLDMAEQALLRLGLSAAATASALSLFRRHDEEMLEGQYAMRDDEAKLIQTSREASQQLKELFESDPAVRRRPGG
ncbi:MAG TPA: cation:proton antiporter, partial [Burkholderiales bacterium]|nr:cation:proton antiporter [Burkholderiales bacterium]